MGHVPAMFLELAEDELALVGAARFMQGRIGVLRAFGDTAEEFGGQLVGFDELLRADDDEELVKVL